MFSPSKAREWWPAWCPGLTEEEDPPSIKQTAEAANRTPPPAPAYPILGAKGHAAGEQAKTNRAAYRSISCIQSYTLFPPFLLSPRSPLILLVAGLYITFAVAEIIPSSSSPTSGLRPAPFHCRHRRALCVRFLEFLESSAWSLRSLGSCRRPAGVVEAGRRT